LFIVVFSGLG